MADISNMNLHILDLVHVHPLLNTNNTGHGGTASVLMMFVLFFPTIWQVSMLRN